MTVDGRLADSEGVWRPLCEREARRFSELLEWADVVVIGSRAVKDSNISFAPTHAAKRAPIKAILDGRLSLSPDLRVFLSGPPTIVFAYKKWAEEQKLEALRERGVLVELLDEYPFAASTLLEILSRKYKVERVLVAGGGETNWTFLSQRAFDDYVVTISPQLLGAGYAPTGRLGLRFPGLLLQLKEVRLCACGQEVILRYKPLTADAKSL